MDAFNPRGITPRKTRELTHVVRCANAYLIQCGEERGMRFVAMPDEGGVFDARLGVVVDYEILLDVFPEDVRKQVLWSA